MTSMSSTSLSICAFAISASIYVGYRNIKRELQRLQTEVVNCNRRDFSRRLEGSDASCNMAMKKIDLLLEMHSVISHEKMEDVIQRVVDVAYNIFRAQRISVMILNRKKTHFNVLASRDAEGKEIDASKGIGSVVISSGEMLNVKNAYQDERFNPECDLMTGFRTESLLCAPLIANNETVGVVYVINKIDDQEEIAVFEKDDEVMLEYFASTASIAIKKAQMYHDAVRSEKNAQALLTIVRSRSSDEVLENVFLSTIDTVYQLLLPDCVSVFICDQATQEAWVCVNKGGVEGVEGIGISVKYGQGIAGTVAANGQTVRVANAYDDGRFYDIVDRKTGYKTKSVLCVGVPGYASNSKPVAVIQLLNKLNGKAFTQDDEDSLDILCKELSMSLRRKIEEMSFLRQATFGRNKLDKDKHIRLEESFLNEFGAVSQCYKFSTIISNKSVENSENKSEADAKSAQYSVAGLDDATVMKNRDIINKWDFNPFITNDGDLMQYSVQMFADFGLLDALKIDIRKLKNFIMGAHALYHEDAHFHNFKHAWSVMHMAFLILRHGASKYLTPLDLASVLLAALCHDLDHPGTNNGFEVAAQSELALTHSYDAVLERHHASMTHRLLNSANSNILENLLPEEQTYIRGVVTDAILATNMGVHFDHVARLEIASKSSPPFDVTSASSRRDLVGLVVHAADLSGQVLPLDLAKKWGENCLAEFIYQASQEEVNGYPVTPFMAALDTELQRMKAQTGFVGNIVLPLWTALAVCFPALNLRCCQAQSNHDYYAHCVQLETAVLQQQRQQEEEDEKDEKS